MSLEAGSKSSTPCMTNVSVRSVENPSHTAFLASAGPYLGSLLAFIFSQTLDVYVYSAIRRIFPSDRLLWLRNGGSTAVSQLFDTFIFTAVAFLGVYPAGVWLHIFISTYLIKFAVSLISLPYAYL